MFVAVVLQMRYILCSCTPWLSHSLDPYNMRTFCFLGPVRKIAKSDYQLRHIRLSVRMEQFCFHWTEFGETLYLSFFFRKSVEKIEVSLKPNSYNGYFT